MKTLAKAKQKHKNLAEFIVSLDKDGKIIFLEYEDFCNKQKTLGAKTKYRVVPCLQILLEQGLIATTQIPDILKIIENHFSITMKKIWDFVQGVDDVGKIILLPRKEFYEKFGIIKDRSELELLIARIKSSLFNNDLISKKYIKEQWQTVEQFWNFFDDELKFINTRNQIEWEMEIKNYVLSDIPIKEKLIGLIDFKADIEHIQLSGDKGLQPKIDYLKIRIKQLKQKQKFTSNRQATTKKESEIFMDYSNNSKAERVVFLHELGILEFLQDKMIKESHGFSANKLAEIISSFTDMSQVTAQSYLNPIFANGVKQDNNPLTDKNLEKVKTKLKNIGLNTSKTI